MPLGIEVLLTIPLTFSGIAEVRLFTGKDVSVRAFEFVILSDKETVEIAEATVGPQMDRWRIACEDGVEGHATKVSSYLPIPALPGAAVSSNTQEERGVRGTAREGRVIASLKLASHVAEGTFK